MTEEFDHVEFMKNGDWPRWPHLPVKRPQFGVGLLLWGQGPVVFLANLYDATTKIADAKTIKYSSFEAMYEDGWRVD